MLLEKAKKIAQEIVDAFEPVCHRVEVAGSVRRKIPTVGDIEIVLEPVVFESKQRTLLGDPFIKVDKFDELLEEVMKSGILQPHPKDKRMGPRYKKLWCPAGIQIDLFIVRLPATWGVIYALRTGPADFNKRIVTECKSRGLRVKDGHVEKYIEGEWRTMPTPEEADFFYAIGLPYLPPEDRR